jgi:hypothetical protein
MNEDYDNLIPDTIQDTITPDRQTTAASNRL